MFSNSTFDSSESFILESFTPTDFLKLSIRMSKFRRARSFRAASDATSLRYGTATFVESKLIQYSNDPWDWSKGATESSGFLTTAFRLNSTAAQSVQ